MRSSLKAIGIILCCAGAGIFLAKRSDFAEEMESKKSGYVTVAHSGMFSDEGKLVSIAGLIIYLISKIGERRGHSR